MKKHILIPVVLLFAVIASMIWLQVSAPEDKWICEKGEWVKHGNPSDVKPETICGETTQKVGKEDTPASVDADNEAKWNRIKEVIADCGVVSISQSHDSVVTVSLRNTLIVKAKEPAIDDVVKLEKEAEGKCGKVPVTVE